MQLQYSATVPQGPKTLTNSEDAMNRPETEFEPETTTDRQIIPARKLKASVAKVLRAQGRDFVSKPIDALELTYNGIKGDFHEGLTRKSGSREPWYERGTQMRNERQLSILSVEELAQIAENLGLMRVEPGWIGANLVLEGVPDLSFLPPRSLMMFDGGVTLRVDGYNAPCRTAGGAVAEHVGSTRMDGGTGNIGLDERKFDWTRTDMALGFTNAAHMKRGLVAWVEREGTITTGETVTIRIWEQWIY